MAPVSTIKEIFFLATTPSTLSSELVFRTQARGLEPRPGLGTTFVELGWDFEEKWGSPQMRQGIPVDIPLSRSGRWEPPSPSSSVPIGHRLGMLLWGATGLDTPAPVS